MNALAHVAPCLRGCGMDFALHVEHNELAGVFEGVTNHRPRRFTRARGSECNEMAVARIGNQLPGLSAGALGKTETAGCGRAAAENEGRQFVTAIYRVCVPAAPLRVKVRGTLPDATCGTGTLNW